MASSIRLARPAPGRRKTHSRVVPTPPIERIEVDPFNGSSGRYDLRFWHSADAGFGVSLERADAIDFANLILDEARRPQHGRLAPVTDHEAVGDGSPDPTWCSCGRLFSEHERRPR